MQCKGFRLKADTTARLRLLPSGLPGLARYAVMNSALAAVEDERGHDVVAIPQRCLRNERSKHVSAAFSIRMRDRCHDPVDDNGNGERCRSGCVKDAADVEGKWVAREIDRLKLRAVANRDSHVRRRMQCRAAHAEQMPGAGRRIQAGKVSVSESALLPVEACSTFCRQIFDGPH